MDPLVAALRRDCRGMPIGVITGLWASSDPAARTEQVRAWRELPDYASVNWHEEGAEELADLLLDRGIGVEAGVWLTDAARKFNPASPPRTTTADQPLHPTLWPRTPDKRGGRDRIANTLR